MAETSKAAKVREEATRGPSRRLERSRYRRLLRRAALVAFACGVLGVAFVAVEWSRLPEVDELLRTHEPSTVVLARDGSLLRMTTTVDGRLMPWAELDEIHPQVIAATIAAEDERFRSHPGVDPIAVARAAWSNLRSGRIVSGASTITMQVTRLLRPVPRSFLGKFREALLALKFELALEKDEILELYLNLSPYGGNVHGVEGAALRYFGRSAGDLSLSEAALIAGLPQAPSRLRPHRHPQAARKRRDWILARLERLGMVSPEASREARAARVRAGEHVLPFAAPHFTEWVLHRLPRGRRHRTTLDPVLQGDIEQVLKTRLQALSSAGVRNVAGLVVETQSGKVRAWVGSQDFHAAKAGQVDGVTARRSPGSLLKPFIYGLAFERRITSPGARIDDLPRHYRDGYSPVNFERSFAGSISVGDALVRSLNTPAVALLEEVGVDAAIRFMRSCGLTSIAEDPARYGLSLALGGADVSLLELVEAYSALARGGCYRPLVFLEDAEPLSARRVLAEEAARDLASVLEAAGWSDAERHAGVKLPRLALKTGTSFKQRDAWAIAYSPRYTIGVWFGNFAGDSSPALVGRTAAVPAALAIARRVHSVSTESRAPDWYGPESRPRRGHHGAEAADEKDTRLAASATGRPGNPRGSPRCEWLEPPDGATFARHALAGGDAVTLRAGLEAGESAAWFVDGEFLGRTRGAGALRWPLLPGEHRITLVGPDGTSAVRTIRVE